MSNKLRKSISKTQQLNVPVFPEYMTPNGYLDASPETHALFFYYLNARRVYETYILDAPIVYEGDPDPEYNLEQLFNSTAMLYDVRPENMANAWIQVDKQCDLLKIPKLPNEVKYRFNYTHNIIQ